MGSSCLYLLSHFAGLSEASSQSRRATGILAWPLGLVWKAGGLTAHLAALTFSGPSPAAGLHGGLLPVFTGSGEPPMQGSGHVQRVAVVILEAPNCQSTGLRPKPG